MITATENPNFGVSTVCRSADIAAYLDNELDELGSLEIEMHLAICPSCRRELNDQKRFLGELNSRMSAEQMPEPPADFARIIAVNAEGAVSGLNSPRERLNALSAIAMLTVATLAVSVFASNSTGMSVVGTVEKTFAMGSAIAGFIESLSIGVLVLVRSMAIRIPLDVAALIVVPAMLLIAIPIFDSIRGRAGDDR